MNFDEIREQDLLLFESIRGSHLFGLNTENSDLDTFGIFCCPEVQLLGTGRDYISIIESDKNDDYWDEIGKFIRELGKSNPSSLEALFTPECWIKYYNPVLDPLWKIRDSLITKQCFKSFAGYSKKQINKATGLGKAINIDPKKVERRKSPIEFCYVAMRDGDGTIRLDRWLSKYGLNLCHCGIVHLPGTIETYNLYYDWFADKDLKVESYAKLRYNSEPTEKIRKELEEGKKTEYIAYRGLLDPTDSETSQLRCSSVTKEDSKYPLCTFQYNINAFSESCKEYKRYWDWVKNRNPERYKLNKGYNYDGKNCCHCIRLMTMAKELAEGKGMLLDRSNIDKEFLLSIKTHQVPFDDIMKFMKSQEEDMLKAFSSSKLPDEPDKDLLEDILIGIRKEMYKK